MGDRGQGWALILLMRIRYVSFRLMNGGPGKGSEKRALKRRFGVVGRSGFHSESDSGSAYFDVQQINSRTYSLHRITPTNLFQPTDDHEHGTHCAGTAVGSTVGLCHQGEVVAAKVLGNTRFGYNT